MAEYHDNKKKIMKVELKWSFLRFARIFFSSFRTLFSDARKKNKKLKFKMDHPNVYIEILNLFR